MAYFGTFFKVKVDRNATDFRNRTSGFSKKEGVVMALAAPAEN